MTEKTPSGTKASTNRFAAIGSLSMKDVQKFQELDTSKYTIKKKPKKVKRSIFDAGFNI